MSAATTAPALAHRHYVPGLPEAEWHKLSPFEWRPWCDLAIDQKSRADIQEWLSFTKHAKGPTQQTPHATGQSWFSRMNPSITAPNQCTEYIEPLVGTARHPFSLDFACRCKSQGKCGGEWPRVNNVFNTSYLMLANHCGPRDEKGCWPIGGGHYSAKPDGTARRSLYYDMGCVRAAGRDLGPIERGRVQAYACCHGQACLIIGASNPMLAGGVRHQPWRYCESCGLADETCGKH